MLASIYTNKKKYESGRHPSDVYSKDDLYVLGSSCAMKRYDEAVATFRHKNVILSLMSPLPRGSTEPGYPKALAEFKRAVALRDV
jgi:hypothetical protein